MGFLLLFSSSYKLSSKFPKVINAAMNQGGFQKDLGKLGP